MDNRVSRPLLAAVGCGSAFGALLLLAYAVGPAQRLDVTALGGLMTLRTPDSMPLAEVVARSADPLPLVVFLSGICALGLFWGRTWQVGAAVWVVATGAIASQALKIVLAHPRAQPAVGDGIEAAAFPSGHATAAMSLAVALVIVMPRRLRPAAASAGALYVLAVSISICVLGWHYPSDVIGGMLLATGLGFVALGGLRRYGPSGAGAPARGGISPGAALELVLTCAATIGVVVALSRGADVVDYARDQTVAAATAGLVAAASAALLSVFALLARE